MNSSKDTKKYEGLSTRANHVLLNAGFNGDKDNLIEILSGMSLYQFTRKYKNGGKVTYLELRKFAGWGMTTSKIPAFPRPSQPSATCRSQSCSISANMVILVTTLEPKRKSSEGFPSCNAQWKMENT